MALVDTTNPSQPKQLAPRAYLQEIAYDEANRVLTETTGVTSTALQGAGGTSSVLQVSLGGTGSAGAKGGTVFANYASDGTGTSGLGAMDAGSQELSVSGSVYRLAVGSFSTNSVNLGNIRAGGVVGSSSLVIGNGAAADGYSDLLVVNGTAGGGFTLGVGSLTLSAGKIGRAHV